MRFPRRFQFGLRTLLIAMLFLGMAPWLALKWREDRLWKSLQAAKQRRDDALVAWRIAYAAFDNEKSSAAEAAEVQAQTRYYAAREEIESATQAIHSFYDNSEEKLARAIDARHRKK
jgi:hypothetical protein